MSQNHSEKSSNYILHILGLFLILALMLSAPFYHIVSSPKGYHIVSRDHPGIGPLFMDTKKSLRHPDLVPVKVRESL